MNLSDYKSILTEEEFNLFSLTLVNKYISTEQNELLRKVKQKIKTHLKTQSDNHNNMLVVLNKDYNKQYIKRNYHKLKFK